MAVGVVADVAGGLVADGLAVAAVAVGVAVGVGVPVRHGAGVDAAVVVVGHTIAVLVAVVLVADLGLVGIHVAVAVVAVVVVGHHARGLVAGEGARVVLVAEAVAVAVGVPGAGGRGVQAAVVVVFVTVAVVVHAVADLAGRGTDGAVAVVAVGAGGDGRDGCAVAVAVLVGVGHAVGARLLVGGAGVGEDVVVVAVGAVGDVAGELLAGEDGLLCVAVPVAVGVFVPGLAADLDGDDGRALGAVVVGDGDAQGVGALAEGTHHLGEGAARRDEHVLGQHAVGAALDDDVEEVGGGLLVGAAALDGDGVFCGEDLVLLGGADLAGGVDVRTEGGDLDAVALGLAEAVGHGGLQRVGAGLEVVYVEAAGVLAVGIQAAADGLQDDVVGEPDQLEIAGGIVVVGDRREEDELLPGVAAVAVLGRCDLDGGGLVGQDHDVDEVFAGLALGVEHLERQGVGLGQDRLAGRGAAGLCSAAVGTDALVAHHPVDVEILGVVLVVAHLASHLHRRAFEHLGPFEGADDGGRRHGVDVADAPVGTSTRRKEGGTEDEGKAGSRHGRFRRFGSRRGYRESAQVGWAWGRPDGAGDERAHNWRQGGWPILWPPLVEAHLR